MTDKKKESRLVAERPSEDARTPHDPSGSAQEHPRQAGASPGPASRSSGAEVHAYISRQLRAVYDDVAKQPVPERFLDLMRQLDAKTGGR